MVSEVNPQKEERESDTQNFNSKATREAAAATPNE